jgi:hypothetical protein
LVTSSNGVDWTPSTVYPAFDLNDAAYGNGMWMIVGDGSGNRNGSIFTSANGLSWTWTGLNFGKNIRSVLFQENTFVLTANDGLVLATSQLTNGWRAFYLPASNLRGASFAHGQWMFVGNNGAIFTMTNLLDSFNYLPVLRPSRTFENLHDVVYLDGKFVTIGNRGTVLQSARFVTELDAPRYQVGLGATLTIKAFPGRGYQIQGTTNLVNWTNLFLFTNTVERTIFTDSNATLYPRRFYRVLEP